jgi:prolyl 4-hydroxylase
MILSKACRGKLSKSNEELSKLHCRYESRTPFTKIAPFKIEEANLNPYIAIFYDILSDNEINAFMSMLTDLSRAEILSPESKSTVSRRRVAKLRFFYDQEHEKFPMLMRRVGGNF